MHTSEGLQHSLAAMNLRSAQPFIEDGSREVWFMIPGGLSMVVGNLPQKVVHIHNASFIANDGDGNVHITIRVEELWCLEGEAALLRDHLHDFVNRLGR